MDSLLQGGHVLPIVPLRQHLHGDILIRDGRIVALGAQAAKQVQKTSRVVDLDGAWVLPAFIQTQVVLREGLLSSGLDVCSQLQPRASKKKAAQRAGLLRSLGRLEIARLLLSGTTTALDAGLHQQVDSFFSAARDLGARLFSGLVIASDQTDRPQAGRGSVQAALADAEKLRKLWDGTDQGHFRCVYLPGDLCRCDEDLLVELAGRARAGSCLVHCRMNRRGDVAKNLQRMHNAGLTGPDVVMALGGGLSARDHKLLRDSGSRVSLSPVSDLRSGFGLPRIADWNKHAVHLSLGSGSIAKAGSHQVIEALRTLSLTWRHRGARPALDAWELLSLVTINAAEALGLDRELGSIEPGKKADLVVIKPNTLSHDPGGDDPAEAILRGACSADIEHVLVDGDFVVRDGGLVHFEQERIVRDAHRLLASQAKSVKLN